MAQRPPLLRDLIPIKESISTSDYVLSLAEATTPEGVERALANYVLTDRLRENFNEALDLIKSAVDGHTSKAAYLHGSFGSGKSHFMAVLYALLSRNRKVWGDPDFDPVLTRHEWIQNDGKKFLLVPYHMLGAQSLEQRVLGRYVEYVKRLHPDAPVPQVYKTDALFDDIRRLRASMGDDAVINGLGVADAGDDDEDDWGDSFGWTPALLDRALAAEESHEEGVALDLLNPSTPVELRAKLVQDASTRLLPGFAKKAAEDEHGFISLDAGLSVIAEHAKSLGYDGLILFLDELVLWLATLIHDQKLVAREAGKITNFVEGGDARRAIPVVSFIARQRDLRELVGEEVSGAAEAAIQDTLNLASGRFDKITLEDRNLPQIANARLLTPIGGPSGPAAQEIDEAFQKIKALGPNIWDTLLGSDKSTTGADEESFRLTYPFSPAFMDTLVHISSALQRSRTGLKLMGELLAANRDHLRLGDLIAVGDLYPVIARGGDKPFVDDLKVVFAAADKLYKTKLRPYLLNTHEVTEDDVQRYLHDPEDVTDPQLALRCKVFVGDNRLVCTLLLSALAPSVPALNDLTLRRLGALNHGSVIAPIPGSEVGIIKSKIEEWAARFPEIKQTGTPANPGVRLELTGVDVDSVIANARVNNNPGNRGALARRLLVEELGVEHTSGRLGGGDELNLVWKGSQRTLEVVFGNVADEDELPDHDLMPQIDGRWRIVIDLPFDEGNYGPAEDVNRIRKLRAKQRDPARTVAWLPTHLSAQRYEDFERLVIIDKALADDQRFATQYAAHLNADNRDRAKGLLESQHAALLRQVKDAFRQAYGLKPKDAAHVQVEFDQHFQPLPGDLPELKVQFGRSMREAVRHIAGRLLEAQFPAHPDLDPGGTGTAVKPSDARTVFGYVRAAAEARDHQVEVPAKDRRLMARLVEPLRLGTQREAYFKLSHAWADDFRLKAKSEGVTGDLSLITLLDWIDRPRPRGLDTFLAHLIVASFAEMDDRVWVRGGVPLTPAPELNQIKNGDALRTQPLPSQQDWDAAGERFQAIFGRSAPALRRGRLVNQFARQISEEAQAHRSAAADLVRQLEEHSGFLKLDEIDGSGRLQIARRSVELLKALESVGHGSAGAKKTVETFARFDLGEVSADRYGTSVKRAHDVAQALAGAAWDVIALAGTQGFEGAAVLEKLRGVARVDQRTADLVEALKDARREVTALLGRDRPSPPPGPAPPGPAPGPTPPPGPEKPDDIDLGNDSSHPPVSPDDTTPSGGGSGTARRSGTRRTSADRAADDLRRELAELKLPAGATIEITWRVVD
ncbi:BREX-2 system ATPase PglY [Actinomadura formosensis]|uniref:BREX-2 system ATPase PglY n=1 Tax=Actinomadura formosensis TaxID=60706 RepID=UPI00082991C9|nr:phage resistance protein [Actinomadura formosensis]